MPASQPACGRCCCCRRRRQVLRRWHPKHAGERWVALPVSSGDQLTMGWTSKLQQSTYRRFLQGVDVGGGESLIYSITKSGEVTCFAKRLSRAAGDFLRGHFTSQSKELQLRGSEKWLSATILMSFRLISHPVLEVLQGLSLLEIHAPSSSCSRSRWGHG